MIARVFALAALAVVLATPARAAGPTTLNAREQQLEARVMCPTCHQLLSLSSSPVAERMRRFIRSRLDAGQKNSTIERELVDEFGPAVLAEPPAHGFGLLAWLLPACALAAAAAAVLAVARAWHNRTQLEDAAAADVSPELLRRLERELAAFDD
jgi:cytochrome c-type biogenesis protein CcmH/NrfF